MTQKIPVEQQVAMFLWIINYSASYGQVAEHFGIKSLEPISWYYLWNYEIDQVLTCVSTRYFHLVLQGILELYKEVIKLPDDKIPLADQIYLDDKYKTFFSDCLAPLMVHILMCMLHRRISPDIEIVRGISPKTCLRSVALIWSSHTSWLDGRDQYTI